MSNKKTVRGNEDFVGRLMKVQQLVGDTIVVTVGVRPETNKLDIVSVDNTFESKKIAEAKSKEKPSDEFEVEIPDYIG
jgi:hypothetical protein